VPATSSAPHGGSTPGLTEVQRKAITELMRVSPVAILRRLGSFYVNTVLRDWLP